MARMGKKVMLKIFGIIFASGFCIAGEYAGGFILLSIGGNVMKQQKI